MLNTHFVIEINVEEDLSNPVQDTNSIQHFLSQTNVEMNLY